MRLIDADELLDLYSGKRLDETFVPVPVIRQNIKDMPTVQPSTGWISVKDRLPKGGDHVIVCAKSVNGRYVAFMDYLEGGAFDFMGMMVWPQEVTHWMPSPEMPEEEEK